MSNSISNSPIHTLLTTSLVVLLGASLALGDPHPWAENVCNQTIPVKKDIIIEKPVEYKIEVPSMCNLMPCTKTRTETRTDQSIKHIIQHVKKPACCPGYTETPERKCSPICLQSCNNGGKCVAPGLCRCQPEPMMSSPGFVGPTCARFVCMNDDKWGAKCDRTCNCSGNSYCSADTGECRCYPGWRGANCASECDPFSSEADCQESNRLPPIIEPDANIMMSENLVMERQRPQALVLDDTVKVVAEEHNYRALTANGLIGLLSLVSLVFFLAFLVIKRRYDRVRNELYYSTTGSYPPSSTYSEPPPYDSASRSSPEPPMVPSNGNLGKNFSFAAATRNILLGKDLNSLHNKSGDERNKAVFHQRVESHLVSSQKKAEQNIYTDVVLNMRDSNRPPASPPSYSASEDHVYQVPKSVVSSSVAGQVANLSDFSATDESLLGQSAASSSNQTLDEDPSANIYEEIKLRK